MPSRYEPTRAERELLIEWMFLGDCATYEREENILQYFIHCDLRERGSCTRRGVRPTSLGV